MMEMTMMNSTATMNSQTPDPTAHAEGQRPGPVRRAASTLSGAALAASMLLGALGCGGEDTTSTNGAGTPPTPEAPATGPAYAIMYEVYDDSGGSNSYLSVLDTLDIEAVDTSLAREYGGGRAFIQTYGGWLFVGDAQTPEVTRYSLVGNELVTEGTVSFVSEGLRTSQFDSWNVTFISAEKAYLMDFEEGRTIIWNPTTMQILGDIPVPPELLRPGWTLEGTPGVVRDGLLFRTFDWVKQKDAEYSTDFLLAIYDVATDQLLELIPETRCPVPGNLVHQDEAGNIYFSNWIWPVAGTILRNAPPTCVLRVNAGEQRFDPAWTLNYGDVTEQRQGAMFTYLQNDQAMVAAFYDERTAFGAKTDPYSYVGSNNWRIWNVDLASMTGSPLEGIDFNGGAFTPVQFDGRLFLMVPGGEEQNYATQLYEVVDGRARPYVELPGWSYQFVKLR
jgi:hypothetical protein